MSQSILETAISEKNESNKYKAISTAKDLIQRITNLQSEKREIDAKIKEAQKQLRELEEPDELSVAELLG